MQNDDSNKREGAHDSQAEGAGANGSGDSAEAGVQSAHGGVLEKATEGGGAQDAQQPAQGAQGDGAIGDPNWLFSGIWNRSLEETDERVYEPRDRIFATELGKAPVDVYLAMKGTKPSNPPNGRSRRKFEAGNMWEWIVRVVLLRAGIIRSAQERVEIQPEGMCRVSGRLDFIAGGKVDPEKAKAEIAAFELPDAFYKAFDRIVEHLQTKYPEGLADKPLEIKSLSAFMFDILERSKKPLRVHQRQLMLYMEAKGFKIGHIVYICRDDCRMMEFVVLNTEENRKDLHEAIALRSGYYLRDEMPPLEKPVLWDPDMLKFTKNNLGMAYSPYLTKLYGYKDQEAFDEVWAKKATNFNRVLKRMAQGAKITDKNTEVIMEMGEMGFKPAELAKLIPKDAPDEEDAPAE